MGDEYTGAVRVGGPAQTRELPALSVTKLAVGDFDNNAYVLRCRRTGEALLIDAAAEAGRLLAAVGTPSLSLIVTTHGHPDHWQALAEVVAQTGAPVAAHPADAGELPVPVRVALADGDTVRVGDVELSVLHLVGHTPGSVALLYAADGSHLFTGDCLFPGGPGNTFGSRENFERLMADLQEKVFDRLPDSTWIYPGHGNDTTLGAERPHLAEWRERGW